MNQTIDQTSELLRRYGLMVSEVTGLSSDKAFKK